ncbi:ice-binding family protein [Jatrophihabitans sp.]|uniref:ice-binding family protein n=1 Tax=Jatrophihabitans sp. TaxID=1932789 RepID=UPI0030C6EE19|nr:hypothetical protein [Jatrophihabitans sp.]
MTLSLRRTAPLGLLSVALLAAGCLSLDTPARATAASITLGTAGRYSVLAGSGVSNIGPSTLNASLGVSPDTAVSGFPPGIVGGSTNRADGPAGKAQADLTVAYDAAAGQAPDATVSGDLVGKTLTPGVYKANSSLLVSGTLTLNAKGNPAAVFIFQIGSTLTTASASHIAMINGAQGCHVYWQVGSSATLGTHSRFTGTVMALASITVTTGTSISGRALARNGAVTLDHNRVTAPTCTSTPPTSTPPTSPTATPTTTPPGHTSSVPTSTPTTTAPGGGTSSATLGGTSSATLGGTSSATLGGPLTGTADASTTRSDGASRSITSSTTAGTPITPPVAQTGTTLIAPGTLLATLAIVAGTGLLLVSRRRYRKRH